MKEVYKKIEKDIIKIGEKCIQERGGDALDGDGVDELVRMIYFELQLVNGNITEKEYKEGLDGKTDIFIEAVK